MATIQYLESGVTNFVEAATVTASSANSAFPATNVSSSAPRDLSNPWKSAATVVTGAKLLFDLGSAKAVTAVVVAGHNVRSGGTVTVRAGTGADPDGSAFSTTLSIRDDLIWKVIASSTYQFWSIQFDDSGNPDTHVRASYVMLGAISTFPQGIASSWNIDTEMVQPLLDTELGSISAGPIVSRPTTVNMSWEGLSAADRNTIVGKLRDWDQNTLLFLSPDPDDTEGYLGVLDEGFAVTQTHRNSAAIEFALRCPGFGVVTGATS